MRYFSGIVDVGLQINNYKLSNIKINFFSLFLLVWNTTLNDILERVKLMYSSLGTIH